MSTQQVYGIGGMVAVGPPVLTGFGAPLNANPAQLGQLYYDKSTSPFTAYIWSGQSWIVNANAAGSFTTLAVSGVSNLADVNAEDIVATGEITSGGGFNTTGDTSLSGDVQIIGATLSIDTGTGGESSFTALTVTTNTGTGVCANLHSSAATVDCLQCVTGGIKVTPVTVTAGASPRVCNARHGQVTFSGVSIAAAATQTLVVTNSMVTAAGTVVLYSMEGGTSGSALSIQSVTNSAGSSSIVVANGTGATTSTANLTFVFWVMG